jgi:effector-binding domain-containing protein
MTEADYAALITAAHRYLDAPVIVIWDNLNTHLSRKMRAFTTSHPDWLTVIQLPAYAPDLNPVHVATRGSGGWQLRWSGLRRMLRAMTVDVTVQTIEPTPTAVVVAATTWAEFPAMWGPMLDKVWSFLRGGAPEGLYKQGHNIMLYKDDVPNVEVGVQVSGSFDPTGHVVGAKLPGGLVATATHTGRIAEIGTIHQAVCEWSKANGYRLTGPRWEIYGDPDPSNGDFDVQVFWLLAAP